MFTETAQYYDAVYSFKDYGREAARLSAIVRRARPRARRLLDVACGTGRHIEHLRGRFDVEGVDISTALVREARRRNPGARIRVGDMMRLGLPPVYDAVVCLFSSIGYVRTPAGLARAIRSMAGALAPGGVLVVEPWFTPSAWKPGTVHALLAEQPGLRVARVSTSRTVGGQSIVDMHYLVGTARGVRHCVETHRLGLFTVAQMRHAFRGAGLRVSYDRRGLTGRGLYIGTRPLP
jgi:SAM-dependent methyltransferase